MGATPKASSMRSLWLMRTWIAITQGKHATRGSALSRRVAAMSLVSLAVCAVTMVTAFKLFPASMAALGNSGDIQAYAVPPASSGMAPFLVGPKASIDPHGPPGPPGPDGVATAPALVQLMVGEQRKTEILGDIASGKLAKSWTLTQRQTCDTELLLNGGFSPLVGFMDRHQYAGVISPSMRLGRGVGLGVAADEDTGRLMVSTFGYDKGDGSPAAGGRSYYAPGVAGPTLPTDGLLWSMPITLDMPVEALDGVTTVDGRSLADMEAGKAKGEVQPGPSPAMATGPYGLPVLASSRILLRDAYHNAIAVITVTDMWRPDVRAEAVAVFGSDDDTHPGVHHLLHSAHAIYVGGIIEGLAMPQHYDFNPLRRSPAEVRSELARRGWARTVAFQTRNPMHRAHIELTRLAGEQAAAGVLLHPVVGMTKPGDVEYAVRVRCYEAVAGSGRYYRPGGVLLSVLPLAMRMGGPREALWHATIRKNYGATHFIVGRDHAGVKSGRTGKDFYGPYDAQALVLRHAQELGMNVIPFQEVEYVPRLDQYLPLDKIPAGEKTLSISGTKFRAMMARGEDIPAWFSDPGVIGVLRALQPPTRERGFVVFFSGLSGGGKTTLSHALIQRLQALVPTRKITILDGDVVRTHLSKGLGFSITDRNANIERIGFVAAEAARHGGIVIAAPIAPFESARAAARKLVQATGAGFIMVHVATTVGECATRDVKGLYGASGYGRVVQDGSSTSGWRVDLSSITNDLTGISHPYEHPQLLPESVVMPDYASALAAASGKPFASKASSSSDGPAEAGTVAGVDVWLDTEDMSVGEGAAAILARLVQLGYIEEEERGSKSAGQADTDDDGIGKRASRLTKDEQALVAALKVLKAGTKDDKDTAVPSCNAPSCSPWLSSVTGGPSGLAHVFPTAVAEMVGRRAAATMLAGSADTDDPNDHALPRAVCRADWDHFLVPAVETVPGQQDGGKGKGRPVEPGQVGLKTHQPGAAAPDAHDDGPVFALQPSTGHTLVRLHAGLPSRGSPSSLQLQQGTAGGKATMEVGRQPPALTLVIMTPSTASKMSVEQVLASLSSRSQGMSTVVGVLPPARVGTSMAWAAGAEGPGKAGQVDAASLAPVFVPSDTWASMSSSDRDHMTVAHAAGQAPVLAEAPTVAAAHDLWTGLRWTAAAYTSTEEKGVSASSQHDSLPRAVVLVPSEAARDVLALLPPMMRLDPCLTAMVLTGEGEGKDEEYQQTQQPGRLRLVPIARIAGGE